MQVCSAAYGGDSLNMSIGSSGSVRLASNGQVQRRVTGDAAQLYTPVRQGSVQRRGSSLQVAAAAPHAGSLLVSNDAPKAANRYAEPLHVQADRLSSSVKIAPGALQGRGGSVQVAAAHGGSTKVVAAHGGSAICSFCNLQICLCKLIPSQGGSVALAAAHGGGSVKVAAAPSGMAFPAWPAPSPAYGGDGMKRAASPVPPPRAIHSTQRMLSPRPRARNLGDTGKFGYWPSPVAEESVSSPLGDYGPSPVTEESISSPVAQYSPGFESPGSEDVEGIDYETYGAETANFFRCDALDQMILPGDVLFAVAHETGRLWDIGRAGGFMGHVLLASSKPRRIPWNSDGGVEFSAMWPQGGVAEIWKIDTVESTRSTEGLHEASILIYVDNHGRLTLIGEESSVNGLSYQDHEVLELWQSPPGLRDTMRLDLIMAALEDMRAEIGEFDWSAATAARAVLTSASIVADTLEAEVAACWEREPICTSVVISFWQRYLCKFAEVINVQPIALIRQWMPLKADRGLPGELLAAMRDAGWVRVPSIARSSPLKASPVPFMSTTVGCPQPVQLRFAAPQKAVRWPVPTTTTRTAQTVTGVVQRKKPRASVIAGSGGAATKLVEQMPHRIQGQTFQGVKPTPSGSGGPATKIVAQMPHRIQGQTFQGVKPTPAMPLFETMRTTYTSVQPLRAVRTT